MTEMNTIKEQFLYGQVKSDIDRMADIFSARDRQAAWQLLGSQQNLYYLMQEQLLVMYFRENVELEIDYPNESVQIHHDESITDEQAFQIICEDFEDRMVSLHKGFDFVIERYTEMEMEPESEPEQIEKVITEEENIPNELEDNEILEEIGSSDRKKNKFRRTYQKSNDIQTFVYPNESSLLQDTGYSDTEYKRETFIDSGIMENSDSRMRDSFHSEVDENPAVCHEHQSASTYTETERPQISRQILDSINREIAEQKELAQDYTTFNSKTDDRVINPDKINKNPDCGNCGIDQAVTDNYNHYHYEPTGMSKLETNNEKTAKSSANGDDDAGTKNEASNISSAPTQNTVTKEGQTEETLRKEEKFQAWSYHFSREGMTDRLGNQGRFTVGTIRQQLEGDIDRNSHDSYTFDGAKVMAAFVSPAGNTFDYLTYGNIIRTMKKEEEFAGTVTGKLEEAIGKNHISFDEITGITDKKELQNKLKEAGLTYEEQIHILKNAETHAAKIELRNNLIESVERDELRLTDKQKELLYSKELFDKKNLHEYRQILKCAGSQTTNQILNQKGIYNMSSKDLKNFIKQNDKYVQLLSLPSLNPSQTKELESLKQFAVTRQEKYMILDAINQKKYAPLQRFKGNMKNILQRFQRIGKLVIGDTDSNATIDGYRQIKQYFNIGRKSVKVIAPRILKFAKSTIKGTAFLTTVPGRLVTTIKGNGFMGYRAVRNPSGRFIKYQFKDTYDSIYKKGGRFIRNKREAVNNAKKQTIRKARTKFSQTKAGKFSTQATNKVKNSTIVRKTKAVKKTVGKGAKKIAESKAARVLKMPFKFVSNAFSFLGKIKMVVITYILTPVLILILIYILILGAYLAVTGISNWMNDSYDKVIYMEQDDITDISKEIQKYDQERYIHALDTAYSPVIQNADDSVYGDYRVGFYGVWQNHEYEEIVDTGSLYGKKNYHIREEKYNYEGSMTEKGYHIYYINSQGEMIGRTTNNLKDCISAAVTMFNNAGLDEEGIDHIKNISAQLYERLNPELTLIQSSIYYEDSGCHDYPEGDPTNGTNPLTYSCCDSSVYTEYERLQTEHVYFYDRLVEQTSEGCKWSSVCDGHEEAKDPDGIPDSGDEYTDRTYCSTTSGTVKSGYKAVCDHCHAEYYCDGDHEAVKICPGHKNINIYCSVLTYEDILNSSNGIIEYKVPSEYSENGMVSAFETRTTDINVSGDWGPNYQTFVENGGWSGKEAKEMIKGLVEQDWYELYGIEVGNIIGYIDGKTLKTEEIEEILSNAHENYNISGNASDMIETALGYVGRIPYDWGGKPTQGSPDGIPNNGLDCSGFVSLVYWETTGIRPSGMGTSTFVQAVGGHRINYSQLQPGDIVLQNLPGNAKNHIGIYVGKNADGIDMFVHCNSSDGNVGCNNWNGWKYYYRIF